MPNVLVLVVLLLLIPNVFKNSSGCVGDVITRECGSSEREKRQTQNEKSPENDNSVPVTSLTHANGR